MSAWALPEMIRKSSNEEICNMNDQDSKSQTVGLMVEFPPSKDIGQAEKFRRKRDRILTVASPLILLFIWEIVIQLGLLDRRLFPAPSMIAGTFYELVISGALWDDLSISLIRICVGFFFGAIAGIFVGTMMGVIPTVGAVLSPIIASIYPIPKIAIFPLIMVLFGLGEMSKFVVVAIAVFFYMVINTVAGVSNVESIYKDVGKSFRVSKTRSIFRIILPAAMPMIIAGLRVSAGVSLLVLVSAEFVGADSGIGYLVWNSWQIFDVRSMFVGIIVIGFLGWASFTFLDFIERVCLPWAPKNRR